MPHNKMYAPSPRRLGRVTRWIGVTAAIAVIVSCGNGGSTESADSNRRSNTVENPSTDNEDVRARSEDASTESIERPEGTWSMLTWHKDDGTENSIGGQLYERIWKFTPQCNTGPCNIDVSAGGVSGTYSPEGEYFFEDEDEATNASFVLTWDESSKEYVLEDEGTNSCEFEDGTSIADGFSRKTTSRLTFTPPGDDHPALLTGDRIETYTSTESAAAAGCDQPDIEFTVSGTPEGSLTSFEPDLVGEYQTTGVVSTNDGNEYASWAGAGPGFSNRFGRWHIEQSGDGFTLTAFENLTMELTGSTPWSGTVTGPPADCADLQTGEYYGEWIITESVMGMEVVGLTPARDPILVTMWELLIPVTPEEASYECGVDDVTARVHLLPVEAIEKY